MPSKRSNISVGVVLSGNIVNRRDLCLVLSGTSPRADKDGTRQLMQILVRMLALVEGNDVAGIIA